MHINVMQYSVEGGRVLRHNPFYPLSVVCLFVGCFAMIRGLKCEAYQVNALVWLAAAAWLYQWLLISVGAMLIKREQWLDGRLLLMLAVVLLPDSTYLISEISLTRPAVGWYIAPIGLSMSLLQAWAIQHIARLTLGRWSAAHLAAMLVSVMFIGQVAASGHIHGQLDRRLVYGGWWLVGLMMAMRPRVTGEFESGMRKFIQRPLGWLFVLMPLLLLSGHLIGLGWAYHAEWHHAFAGPMLLGVSCWLPRLVGREGWHTMAGWQFALPVFGLMLSLGDRDLVFSLFDLQISPMRLCLVSGGVVHAYVGYLHHQWLFGPTSLLLPTVASFGHTFREIQKTWIELFNDLWATLRRIIPTTAIDWGITAMAAAFIFLGLGAWLSFRRSRGARTQM